MPDPYANGICPYGEDQAPGSGCIKPAGHDGAHLITPGDTSDLDAELCEAEYPGDDNFVGQLCERPAGHGGEHRCEEELPGTKYTVLLKWAQQEGTRGRG